MATISNVRLVIQKGGESNLRQVTVSYTVCFTSCEALDETVFVASVRLRGSDPGPDHDQLYLGRTCFKAERGCVDKKISRTVNRDLLDEDADWVFGPFGSLELRDELYARVVITPFSPSGDEANSNKVYGSWGEAGSD